MHLFNNGNFKNIISVSFCVCIFFGCTSKLNEGEEVLKNSTNSLVLSNSFIKASSILLYSEIRLKSQESLTKNVTKIWLSRYGDLNEKTDTILSHLVNLKNSAKVKNVNDFFEVEFDKYILFIKKIIPLNENSGLKFLVSNIKNTKEMFLKASVLGKLNCVEILKNSILLIENKALKYANGNILAGCILTFEKFSTIVGQNSLNFRVGEELVITAGVGSFSTISSPLFTFNKSINMLPNDNGVAIYKKQIFEKPGKYTVPVLIKYVNQDGTDKIQEIRIEYEVRK